MRYLFLLPVVAAAIWLFVRDDRFPDYNYKMTVYIDEHAYSSVRAVEQREKSSILDSSGSTVETTMRGQAVIIDHPSGRTYYALIGKPGSPQYGAAAGALALKPLVDPALRDPRRRTGPSSGSDLDFRAKILQTMVAIEGEHELRRLIPAKELSLGARASDPPFEAWPLFVTFADPSNPATIREVDPAELGIDRITVAITDEDVSEGIEKRLPWLPSYYNRMLSGDRFQALRNQHKGIAAFIAAGAFSAGNGVKQQ